ncbi:MAG: hypothetical protein AAGM04_08510, partial [Pseudomonadota bacterium]
MAQGKTRSNGLTPSSPLTLRSATVRDLERIMALERRGDMLDFIFQSPRDEHEAMLTDPAFQTLIITAPH